MSSNCDSESKGNSGKFEADALFLERSLSQEEIDQLLQEIGVFSK